MGAEAYTARHVIIAIIWIGAQGDVEIVWAIQCVTYQGDPSWGNDTQWLLYSTWNSVDGGNI